MKKYYKLKESTNSLEDKYKKEFFSFMKKLTHKESNKLAKQIGHDLDEGDIYKVQ